MSEALVDKPAINGTDHSIEDAFLAPPRLLTVRGVTERYTWGRTKIYEMIADGRLEAKKFDDRTLILVDSCEQVVAAAPRVVIRKSKPRKQRG